MPAILQEMGITQGQFNHYVEQEFSRRKTFRQRPRLNKSEEPQGIERKAGALVRYDQFDAVMIDIRDKLEDLFVGDGPQGTAAEQLRRKYHKDPLIETRKLSVTRSSIGTKGLSPKKNSTIMKRRRSQSPGLRPAMPQAAAMFDYLRRKVEGKTTILQAIEAQAKFLNQNIGTTKMNVKLKQLQK
jgi:hypothetical protein